MAVLEGALLMLAGGFSAFCAFKDYDWFMESRKARLLVKIFGRKVVRAFYVALGAALIGGGGSILLAAAAGAVKGNI
ncbi:MAG: immunity 17 family protein [Acidaminococcales bacterium]|jgi:hypothetical protein|nr:immunity 17 family protein [Acidaminococcales bacterium]